MKIKIITLLLILLISLFGIQNLSAQQFSLQGDASVINATTYRLTPNSNNKKGMITNLYPKDLTQNFELDFEAFFGFNNGNGADGIAVVFSKACNPVLVDGSGIGASGIPNSVIIEFDTYNNSSWLFDIPQHHITIFQNGFMDSANQIMDNVSQPVCAMANCSIIDTNNWHQIKIKWEYLSSTSQKISVFFNGSLRVTSTKNHINNSFQGNTKVFYSLSAATGAAINDQQVKITDNSVINSVCSGTPVTLTAPELGSNYIWTQGSSTTNSLTFTPTSTGNVTCNYTDFCLVPRSITYNIQVLPNPVTPTISSNSPICNGENAQFTLSGTPGTIINYSINTTTLGSITIPASGTTTINVPSPTTSTVFKLEQISLGTCSVLANTLSTVLISNPPITSPIVSN
ncbi:MAG: lectin-like domain-containing protein [Flavobacterium sp.]